MAPLHTGDIGLKNLYCLRNQTILPCLHEHESLAKNVILRIRIYITSTCMLPGDTLYVQHVYHRASKLVKNPTGVLQIFLLQVFISYKSITLLLFTVSTPVF